MTGWSGTVLNVELVIPALLMNVFPVSTIVTPSPWSTISRSGNASPPWLTKYAGPSRGTGRIGVIALAVPITDAAGHPAGLALNCAAVHAFCNVVNREGSCLGRSTLTCLMFASCPSAPVG